MLPISSPSTCTGSSISATTGAEATENAVKIARAYTGRQAVVCFTHAFHVVRSEFDEILLRHAQRQGAEVKEGAELLKDAGFKPE